VSDAVRERERDLLVRRIQPCYSPRKKREEEEEEEEEEEKQRLMGSGHGLLWGNF
jgi:hypothetical protein